MKKLFTFFSSLILCAFIVQAQPGSLDVTFDPAAQLFTPPAAVNVQNPYNRAVSVQQPDDKTIIYYDLPTYNGVSLSTNIIRITKNGALDSSFNTGTGAAGTIQFNTYNVHAMALQADGKILIGGTFTSINGTPCGGIARLNADGSLDNSFNIGTGLIINDQFNPPGTNGYINSFAIQPDGKIIAVGYFSSYNDTVCKSIVRINVDGSVDNSFSSTSLSFFTGIIYVDGSINSCTLQGTGKIVVGGIMADGNPTLSTTQCLNSDGTVDNGFPTISSAYQVFVQPDDKIIITCPLITANSTRRFNADGSADATFHNGATPIGGSGFLTTVKIQSDGKILVANMYQYSDGQTTAAGNFVRLQSNGLIDDSFSSAISAGGGYPDPCYISFIELTQNNKIITGHVNSSLDFNINRLNSDGSFDNAVAGIYPNGAIENLSLQADGKIIIGGSFNSYNGIARNRIARVNPDGSLDESFTAGLAPNSMVYTTALQADSKILAGGLYFSGSTVNKTFARFNADGTEDVDFTNNLAYGGTSLSGIGTLSRVNKILIQPDGRIIVVANENIGGIVARLNADGTTDESFNVGESNLGSYQNAALQPDGKIIIRGNFSTYSSPPAGTPITGLNNLIRLNGDGSLDLNFTPPGLTTYGISSIALQADGKILLVGNLDNTDWAGIRRINADGTLDTGFVPSPLAQNGPLILTIWALSVQDDGKIFVGGNFNYFTTDPLQHRNDLVRLKPDGSLDSSFNQGATGFTDPINIENPNVGVHASLIQPDGKLLVAGGFNTNFNPIDVYNDIPVYSIARIITSPCPSTVAPSVSIVASETGSICAATPVMFTATPVNGGATPRYQWKKNAVNVGTNSATYTDASFTDGDIITCILHGYEPCLLPDTALSNSIIISVSPYVTPTIGIELTAGPLPVCAGSPLTFTAITVNGGDAPSYQWRITRDGNTFNSGTSAPTFTYDSYNNNDVVSCVLTSSAACASPVNAYSNAYGVAVQYFSNWYLDADGDGYGDINNSIYICGTDHTGYVMDNTDCDDTQSSVNPGAAEICDGLDNDCNGLIDIIDAGGIVCGMATSEGQSFTLTAPAGKVFTSVDFASYGTPNGTCGNYTLGSCNANTSMSVIEPLVVGQNSVTLTQDYQLFGDPCFGVPKRLYVQARYSNLVPLSQTYYADADGDSYGNPAIAVVNCDAIAPSGYVSDNTDCDDTNYSINPGAAEIGQNGIDDNCNGQIDELPYCTPVIEYPCDMWISNTTIGTINNSTTQPSDCEVGGYTDYSGSISTIAAPAETVNYSLKAVGNGYQYGDIYIDYNNDGNFDGVDETVAADIFLENNGDASTGSFTIPPDQPFGYYRMRVKSYEYNEPQTGPCGYNTDGEVEDYTLHVLATYCTPVCDEPCVNTWIENVTLGSSINNTGCSSGYSDYSAIAPCIIVPGETIAFSIYGNSLGSQKANIYVDYNSDFDFDDAGEQVATDILIPWYTAGTGSFVPPSYLAPGNYRIRIVSENDQYDSPTPCHTVGGEVEDYTLQVLPDYCIPVCDEPCTFAWIESITLGTIANIFNGCDGGYSDYTAITPGSIIPGETTTLSIDGNHLYDQKANIYLDYNGDGDFDDADEVVATDISVPSFAAGTGSFVVKSPLAMGNYRVRIVSEYELYDSPTPCHTIWGEVEDYTLQVVPPCAPNGSDIVVRGNSVMINDGDNTPDLADFTDFGNVDYLTAFTRTFSIENTGTNTLHLSDISITGDLTALNFTVINQPENTTLQVGESTTFTVQFLCFTANFLFEAVMHIHNDNCSKKDYDIAIHAYGVCPINGQDINIQGNAIDIVSFDFSPSVEDSTEFGTAASNTTVSKTYTIQNLGSETLNVYLVELFIYDGTHQFDITTQPESAVAPGSSTTFTITFSPEGSGLRFAYVRIQSDDCDAPFYQFAIQGTAESGTFSMLNLTAFLEGLYSGNGQMRTAMDASGPHWGTGIADKITVELHDMDNYSNIIWSANNVDMSTEGLASVMVPSNFNESYYLTIKHRNSIETVSMNPVSFSAGSLSYDFNLPANVFGSNLLLMIDGQWVIYCGDVNQDGTIDTGDMTPVNNDASSFSIGYLITDTNGDGIVDTGDMSIVDNNSASFVSAATP